MILSIFAPNIRQGGGVTHLLELLSNHHFISSFSRIYIIVSSDNYSVYSHLASSSIHLVEPFPLSRFGSLYWQIFHSSSYLSSIGTDILFVPGGTYFGSFAPFVVMCQNLLPFSLCLVFRCFPLASFIRYISLFISQSYTFCRSSQVLFLSEYASLRVRNLLPFRLRYTIVPHGISSIFSNSPKPSRHISHCNSADPLRLLYVSSISPYKHQLEVLRSVYELVEETGWNLRLQIVGPVTNADYNNRLLASLENLDPSHSWASVTPPLSSDALSDLYKQSDIGIFASSCENLPITLLEMMSASLPVVVSNLQPMSSVLGDHPFYFSPYSIPSIKESLRFAIVSPAVRNSSVHEGFLKSLAYNWDVSASQTASTLINCLK